MRFIFYLFVISYLLNVKTTNASNVRERFEDADVCSNILANFSNSVAQFMNCSIYHAQPIHLCDYCVFSYIQVLENYKNLSKNDLNGKRCIDYYEDLDRFQVVRSVYKNVLNLWSKGNCDDCFLFSDGKISLNSSSNKSKFDQLYENFYFCVQENNSTLANDSVYCTVCLDTYLDLNQYYFKIGDAKDGILNLCMDIVDKMNKTQADWGGRCCKYRRQDNAIYVSLTVVMCVLPLVFYASAKRFTSEAVPTILQQSRFTGVHESPSTSFDT